MNHTVFRAGESQNHFDSKGEKREGEPMTGEKQNHIDRREE
jgi:hypothetical protein